MLNYKMTCQCILARDFWIGAGKADIFQYSANRTKL